MARAYMPHTYQKRAIKELVSKAAFGLILDPGLGKTSIVLAALKLLKEAKIINAVLVVAPLRVIYNVWPDEVAKWSEFDTFRVTLLHGPSKDARLLESADIYLINPEGLEWLQQSGFLASSSVDVLVVDESTKFKHPRTRRFKVLKTILGHFKRRYILTGEPAPNGLMDLFGQIYILDRGHAFTPYITKFRAEYFNATGFGNFTYTLKHGSEERIYEKVAPLTLRMAASDYLELPELIHNYVYVELPVKARKIYDDLERTFLAHINDGATLTAATTAAMLTKCRQIANGGVRVDTEGVINTEHLHDARVDAVVDLVDSFAHKPALVSYEFKHDLINLRRAFGTDAYIGGGVPPEAAQMLVAKFNSGELAVLLGHPASMGHGLNLQDSCQNIVVYSPMWDLDLYNQFIKRVYRQGNTHRQVFVHHIVARNTIDEIILKALEQKGSAQARLLTALQEYSDAKAKT